MGARLRRLRGGREAQLAAGARVAYLPAGRLGRARRLRRTRARKLGATLSHHVGDRPSDRRGIRTPTHGSRQRHLRAPPPRRRADRLRRRGRRRAWRGAGADRCSARCRHVTKHHRRVRLPRAGGDRGERRHRRQPRPGPAELAEADGPGARAAAQRRARTRRRPDDRHHRVGGRARHQQRPDVALHRGHHELRSRSGPTTASAFCPRRRRCGSTPPGNGCLPRCTRASTPSARWNTSPAPDRTTPGSC